MASSHTNQPGRNAKVIDPLRRAVLLRDCAGLTDGQLLDSFIDHRDEAAFAALVRKHGRRGREKAGVQTRESWKRNPKLPLPALLWRRPMVSEAESMTRPQLEPVASYLRKMAGAAGLLAADDARLLESFVVRGDPSSFTALVRRHGALVWRVCRRVLHNVHDAEDAFQATFLVLARKAGSIRRPAALASWLHGVAYRISRKARQERVRRTVREQSVPVRPPTDSSMEAACRELEQIVEEEVHGLPEKYRLVLLLCYWEGQSCEGIARRLDCPCGTVKTRLNKGRQLLRARLVRRGVTLSVGVTTILLSPGGAEAALPSLLMSAAARLGQAPAAGHLSLAAVSARVTSLAQPGLSGIGAMATRAALVIALLTGLIIAGAGSVALQTPSAKAPTAPRGTKSLAPDKQRAIPQSTLCERFRRPGEAVALEFSPDGGILASYSFGSPQAHLNLWDTVTGEALGQVAVMGQGVNSRPFAFSPDGKVLAAVNLSVPPSIIFCDPVSGERLRSIPLPQPGPIGPVLLRFSRDGKLLAVAVTADRVHVLDLATGKHLPEVSGHRRHTIFALDFAPDGRALALGTFQPSLQLWSVATGKRLLLSEQQPEDRIVASLAFSRDGKLLAAGRGSQIVLTDVGTGRERARLEAPMQLVNGLAFTPDDKMLVSGSRDGTVRIWDLRSRQVRNTLDGEAEGLSLALAADGTAVALGTVRHLVVWDSPFAHHVPRPKEVNLTTAALERSWSDLADRDVHKVHRAIRTMITAPDQALAVLNRHLHPLQKPGPEVSTRVRRLIADLESDRFTQREIATRELEQLGSQGDMLLRQTLAGGPSAETRRRIERIREIVAQQSVQALRAIKVVEHIGSPTAKQLLEKLARGEAEHPLTREVRAALERLAKRFPGKS